MTNARYACNGGYAYCNLCPVWIEYCVFEAELFSRLLEKQRTMTEAEEKRKYMEDQLKIATGKDKEIEETNDTSNN